MIEQKYSVTRTRATWKPRIADDDLPFYRCPECGRVLQGIAGSLPGSFSDGLRNPMAEPPYAHDMQALPTCCGSALERMELTELDALPEGIEFDYRILGGIQQQRRGMLVAHQRRPLPHSVDSFEDRSPVRS